MVPSRPSRRSGSASASTGCTAASWGRDSEAACRTLEADVARLQRENRERDAALAQAQADFTLGLEKLREAAQRSEERLQAAQKRALLEIDRERARDSHAPAERAG
ncbi:hypothetical protein [Burkholderia ubonensis]|uniref:hypothetical protein n=1 Tax=Burkholderia ubonensis TaxID=101571 RepID=UPI0018DF255A|nr:hypothetical protein [Burkholderia ubonensis]